MTRHLLDVDDLEAAQLATVFSLAEDDYPPRVLAGRGVGLVFQKPSARTRSSSEVAVFQLGGHPVTIRGDEVGIDTRESAEDVARTLAQYHCAIGARVLDHRVLERMAAVSPVPIINLLSDRSHPLQAMADLLTLRCPLGRRARGSPTGLGGRRQQRRSQPGPGVRHVRCRSGRGLPSRPPSRPGDS